jgi:hypothetical protein
MLNTVLLSVRMLSDIMLSAWRSCKQLAAKFGIKYLQGWPCKRPLMPSLFEAGSKKLGHLLIKTLLITTLR